MAHQPISQSTPNPSESRFGALPLFLSPHRPDLKPIETNFVQRKHLQRRLAFRTRDVLWDVMPSMLVRITASDAVNCFRHVGYTLQAD